MPEYLLLRFEAPLQSWGDVAHDRMRPTRGFPARSAIAGLLASALGWRYADGARTTALQDALRLAVCAEREPRRLIDYQTAAYGRNVIGWTRWGVEAREEGTQLLYKHYLADGAFIVAVGLGDNAGVTLDDLESALRNPARPLFLGRRSCPPATPLLVGRRHAVSSRDALARTVQARCRCWYDAAEGPDGEPLEIWDRRDFAADRFGGSRWLTTGWVTPFVEEPT